MDPDPTPVARLDYSTRHEQVPRWVLVGFAYAAILFGTLDVLVHASSPLALWISSSGNFKVDTWRDITGTVLTIGRTLAAMTLVASAVGLIRSERWSRKGAIAASYLIVGMAIINLAMRMLDLP